MSEKKPEIVDAARLRSIHAALAAGREARRNGAREHDNPYSKNQRTFEHVAWADGWYYEEHYGNRDTFANRDR